MRKIVVVGGSLAGVHAAESLRDRGYDGELTIVSSEGQLPYDRPPLSKEALMEGLDHERLLLHDAAWYAEQNITVLLNDPAVRLDTDRRELGLLSGTALAYDGLVIATGSRARRVRTGEDGPMVHVIRTSDDARALRPHLQAGRHLVIAGGGFIGLEVAAAARQLGLRVTIIEGAPVPLARAFSDVIGSWYRDLHERNGVSFLCGLSLESIDRTPEDGVRVHLSDGTVVDGDLIVAGIGAEPAVEWLEGSGVSVGNGIICEADLSTTVPGVVAAGDVARWYNAIFDEEMRNEHWSNAVDQGRHAAGTLLGGNDAFLTVPYFWSDQYDARMRFVGRAGAAEHVHIEHMSDDRLIVLFGRDGLLRGAVCVNAPRQLAGYRMAIRDNASWDQFADGHSVGAASL
jgi:NADPH-dependent 2,4-dienoyl-CoA reductase/sulfur reductase-like enzyme